MILIKEISIVTAYIQANNLLEGQFIDTIDRAYEIAKEFTRMHADILPFWDESKTGRTFEEEIEFFISQNN